MFISKLEYNVFNVEKTSVDISLVYGIAGKFDGGIKFGGLG